MLRSVKYGLYAGALAGLLAGSLAWIQIDKTVQLRVDGHATSLRTTADRVGPALADAGYRVGPHDLVAPAVDSRIHDGSTIVYRHGRLLHLSVDGTRKDVWTTAPTVSAALAALGYSRTDFVSVSRSKRLPLSPTDVTVRTQKTVTVVHDGTSQRVASTDATVGQLLSDLGISVDGDDRISLPAGAALAEGATIVIERVEHGTVHTKRAVRFTTKTTKDPHLLVGQTRIVSPGKDGLAVTTYSVVTVDGVVVRKTKVGTKVVAKPVARVKAVGTKPKPPPPPPPPPSSSDGDGSSGGGSSGGDAPSGHIATPSQAKAIARDMLAERGWSDQYSCLATLWGKESGWRVTAANPSGAYGIPQALPGSKMGPGWRTSATAQISWGLRYIADRYDTPCGAWSYWQSHNYY